MHDKGMLELMILGLKKEIEVQEMEIKRLQKRRDTIAERQGNAERKQRFIDRIEGEIRAAEERRDIKKARLEGLMEPKEGEGRG